MSSCLLHYRAPQVLRDLQASDQMHQAPFCHLQMSKTYRLTLGPL